MTNSYSQLMTFQILLSSPMGRRSMRLGAALRDFFELNTDNGTAYNNEDIFGQDY